ncbi:MAG: CoA transferase [Burkholderiaceae bacterium]|nr:CoA transferase [Burkholderiaceae bacterium]MDO9089061.1 CoA transferase [Burkholderiaceae bacterium]
MKQPLAGLLVVEVSSSVSASFAAALLADFGATVYVIELLPLGTQVRRLTPPSVQSVWWSSIARNKRSVAIDPENPEDLLMWTGLLERVDVVLTDVVEGDRTSHPLLVKHSKLAKPPFIVDIFPTGADNPELWGQGIAPTLTTAHTGMAALTGWADGAPVVVEAPLAECLAGAMGAMALMAELCALKNSARTAQSLSIGMHEAVQRMIEWQLPVASLMGKPELRNGNAFPLNAGISNMHRTADGKHVAISAANQAVAVRLMRLVGGEEMVADERFATPAARAVNMAAIYAAIDQWVGERSLTAVMEAGSHADVVIGPVYDVFEILADEQIRARGNLTSQEMADKVERRSANIIPRIFESSNPIAAAPVMGQHRAEVAVLVASAATPGVERGMSVSTRATSPQNLPLAGAIVLELGTIIAGPFAGSLMADLGATVIKIESPRSGDGLRHMGPCVKGIPIWWAVSVRGKKCISLDLKSDGGRATFEKLVAKADVLIENFRPGVLDRLKLSVSHLHELNPSLVVLSISGFGQTGPYAQRAGFGKIAEGMSGVVPLTGAKTDLPMFVGFSLADTSAGLFGALAVNVALFARGSGKGVHIDLALYEPLLRILDAQFSPDPAGTAPSRQGTNDPYGWGAEDGRHSAMLRCLDGQWVHAILPAQGDDLPVRQLVEGARDTELTDSLRSWTATLNSGDVKSGLSGAGVLAANVQDGGGIGANRYFLSRGDVQTAVDPNLGEFCVPGFFPSSRAAAGRVVFRNAHMGQDTREVLREMLGMTTAEMEELVSTGATGSL